MLRIIAIGDPHFKIKNIIQIDVFIEKQLVLVKEKKPHFIVVLGDLLHHHERIHALSLNKAYEFIDKLRQEAFTYILVGNHDMINNQQFLTKNHWMNGLKEWANVKVIDTTYSTLINNHKFVFCPYVPPGRFIEALNVIEWKDADIIFAHQEFYGCKMGAIESEDGDKWDLELPYIVSGHIHSNQTIQPNIYYPGAAMQHAFGESEKNIIPYFELEENHNIKLEEFNLGLSRKRIIYIDANDLEEYVIPKTNDQIRLTVSGTFEQFKVFKKSKKYKELVKSGLKVIYKAKKQKLPEIKANDFVKILKELVQRENNEILSNDFREIKF